jgi:hypothetical protein
MQVAANMEFKATRRLRDEISAGGEVEGFAAERVIGY